MNFDKLLQKLKSLNLPPDQFLIIGSGPLAIRNIREAQDLDLIVTPQLWEKLTKSYPLSEEYGVQKINLSENIEISGPGSAFLDDSTATIAEMLKTSDVFDNIHFLNLNLLKKFKLKMARPKDLTDIQLIDTHLYRIHLRSVSGRTPR